jgi:hypothetical protein
VNEIPKSHLRVPGSVRVYAFFDWGLSHLPSPDDGRFHVHDALMLLMVPGFLLRLLVSNHDRLIVSIWWGIAANLLFYWSLAYLFILWRTRSNRRER